MLQKHQSKCFSWQSETGQLKIFRVLGDKRFVPESPKKELKRKLTYTHSWREREIERHVVSNALTKEGLKIRYSSGGY